jgi:hypothetical protein
MRRTIWWIGGGLVAIAAIVLFFSWRANQKSAPPAAAVTSPETQVAQPAIQNPIPAASNATVQPLPELDASDAPLLSSLSDLIGKRSTDNLFKPEQLVRHLVVTVDNLSRKRVAVELRPNKALPGAFMTSGDEQHSTLNPANYQRYAPMIQVVQMTDTKALASLYFHYYPLFQQAYQNLGYPNGYFNDRLVATIDSLLATPDVTGDILLTRPNVMYQFADPNLEDLSAGQKAMLRMGPTNAGIVKAKLRDLRAQIAGLPHTR